MCNVTILDSYFGDGTPGNSCFDARTSSMCFSNSKSLVFSIPPLRDTNVKLYSSRYLNYNVLSSYSDETPQFSHCNYESPKQYACNSLSNLIKIVTQYEWDIQHISVQHACEDSDSLEGSSDTTFIAVIVTIVLVGILSLIHI